MARSDLQTILEEIERTKRLLAEIVQSMDQTTMSTQEILARSRELIARAERQLRQR